MCEPATLTMGALSGASMLANSSAQNSVARGQQKDINAQAKLSGEQFDTRQTVTKDADVRIRELEAQGFDRVDATRQAYNERMEQISGTQAELDADVFGAFEREAQRNSQLRADQSAAVGDALSAANFGAFSDRQGSVAAGLDADTRSRMDGATQPTGNVSPEVSREMLRRDAEAEAFALGREASANRLAGAQIGMNRIGDAIDGLNTTSGVINAQAAPGADMFRSELGLARAREAGIGSEAKLAESRARLIEPELKYLDRSSGIISDRAEGVVGASSAFENGMNTLLSRQSAARRPNTMIGDLLDIGSAGVGAYARSGGTFKNPFAAKPSGTPRAMLSGSGNTYGEGLY